MFTLRVYHYLSPDPPADPRLDEALRVLHTLHEKVALMSAQVDALRTAVSNNTVVIDSAVVLLNGLAARIVELKSDPVALQALADEVTAKSQQLGAAVVEHTPSA